MKIYILLLSLFLGLNLNAQFLDFKLKSNNRQLIEEALEESIVDVNQYYILVDTVKNQKLGRNGEDFFNKVSFPGIITEEGVVISPDMDYPWKKDDDFIKYEGKYKPEVTKTEFIIGDRKIQPGDSIQYFENIVKVYLPDIAGVKVDTSIGEKDGWILWLSIGKDGKRTMTSFTKQIEITDERNSMNIEKPDELENVEIGYYFTTSITAPGQITLSLAGVVEERNGLWEIFFPFIKIEEKSQLTPVNDNKSKNKEFQKRKKK